MGFSLVPFFCHLRTRKIGFLFDGKNMIPCLIGTGGTRGVGATDSLLEEANNDLDQ